MSEMQNFEVKLIGLFDNVVHSGRYYAKNSAHAVAIASAIYYDCWKRSEVKVLPPQRCF